MKLLKRTDNTIVLLILLSGFALRLYRLGADSLWYDETVSAVLAQKSIFDLIAHTARDIHPPGYYLLLHFWVEVAGDTEFALAFFSLVFGMLLIAATYRLSCVLFNRRVAAWAAVLTAFSAYHLWYSQEVRMYTLGAFLGVVAVYCAWQGYCKTIRDDRLWFFNVRYWLGYSLTASLGLYILYYFGFLLVALNLFLLGWFVVTWRKGQFNQQKGLGWLGANLFIVGLYLPWLGIAWRQATNPPVPPWRSSTALSTIILESWSALSLGEAVGPGALGGVLILTAGLYGLGLYATWGKKVAFLLPWLTFGPLAIIVGLPLLTGAPLYHIRYLFTYAPPFYIMLGVGLHQLGQQRNFLAGVVLVGVLVGNGVSVYQFYTDPQYASDDFRQAVMILQEKWRPGDVIVVNAGYTYTALQYYFSDPVSNYERLTSFNPENPQETPYHPLILQTGSVDGPANLGWGEAESDFYAMSEGETVAALERVVQTYSRIWQLRAYDTVTDPDGVIRVWLGEHTRLFEDQVFSGNANIRVQGFLSEEQPVAPQMADFSFGDKIELVGYQSPGVSYNSGETVHTVVWLKSLMSLTTEPPYAISLKLWDSTGELATQVDAWPVGNVYFTPDWVVGEVARYPMRLILPDTLRAGEYWLDVQVYRSDEGVALGSFTLGKVVVED